MPDFIALNFQADRIHITDCNLLRYETPELITSMVKSQNIFLSLSHTQNHDNINNLFLAIGEKVTLDHCLTLALKSIQESPRPYSETLASECSPRVFTDEN